MRFRRESGSNLWQTAFHVLRYALRRVLWAIPTLFGVSLVVFLLTSLLPAPETELSAASAHDPFAIDRARRERFLDLPLFVNALPRGVRDRAIECTEHIAKADSLAPEATRELALLGGAAFPTVLPLLRELPSEQAIRVALALAPIGRRIGRADDQTLDSRERSVVYWKHFWEDEELEFETAIVQRNVARLSQYGGALRRSDLALVDTFALQEIIPQMQRTSDHAGLRELTMAAAHATGGGPILPTDASHDELRLVLEAWRSYWFVHRDMHRELTSQSRLGAILTETRYAKWVGGALTGRLPPSNAHISRTRTSLDELAHTLPVTLSLVALAALLSAVIAIPLGVIGAYRRGRPIDVALAFVLMGFHSLPPFALAELFDTWLPKTSIVLPAFALALGTIGVLSRTQRAALLEVLSSDFVRTARAKGAFGARLLVVHALRTALVPMMALAGLQVPVLFGGAVLVEDIFQLPGTGRAVLDAIRQGDTGFVVVCVLVMALVTSLTLVLADLAAGLLDPRIRETLRRRGST